MFRPPSALRKSCSDALFIVDNVKEATAFRLKNSPLCKRDMEMNK